MSALPSKSLRYFVSIAATAAAFIVRFLLKSALGFVAPLLMFTFSVVLSAGYGGLGPGLLATALSLLLGDYFFIDEGQRRFKGRWPQKLREVSYWNAREAKKAKRLRKAPPGLQR